MKFEWDENKNILNQQKHGLSFKDIKELFDSDLWEYEDNRFDYGEKRMICYGFVKNKLMTAAYVQKVNNVIRIISFRRANKRE